MSIYDSEPFFSSDFAESITYTVDGGEGVTLTAIVNRIDRKSFSNKGQESQSIFYPFEIMIRKSDLLDVTVKRDKCVIMDKGKSKTVTIQEILTSTDSFTWILGAV